MNPTIGQLIPVRRLFNVVDERAAVFLNADISSIAMQEPDKLGSRLCVNADIPLEFENDHFKGRVVIIHREPSESTNHNRYRELLSTRKRRWELRWQGMFKQSLPKSVLFGAEIQSSHAPKINIASRTFLSILLRFSKVLARSRGSDLFTNVLKDELGETKYFYFPIHSRRRSSSRYRLSITSVPRGAEQTVQCGFQRFAVDRHHQDVYFCFLLYVRGFRDLGRSECSYWSQWYEPQPARGKPADFGDHENRRRNSWPRRW